MQNIGLHFTIARGFFYAAKTVSDLGGSTFQFFSRNPRGSKAKVYSQKDIDRFRNFTEENKFGPVMAHAPYTINLASNNENIQLFSREVVKNDIARMDRIGIKYYNLHPGNHMGRGTEEGINTAIACLNQVITKNSGMTILLETMSGKGSEIGYRFEHLRQIIDGAARGSEIGICMDLCHVFSSGYDIVNHFDNVLFEFDQIIGLEKLKAVHLNDSKYIFKSRKDGHVPIGRGHIGLDSIVNIMNHSSIRQLPFYLETPLDNEGHRQEINMLKNALARQKSDS